MNNIKINISSKSILLIFALIILTLLVVQVRDLILLTFASFVIASSLLPAINFLSKKIPRNAAVFIVYFFVLAVIITLFIPLFAILAEQTEEFLRQFPYYLTIMEKSLLKWHLNIDDYGLIPNIESKSSLVSAFGKNIVDHTIKITHDILVGTVMYSSLAIMVLFMLLEKDELKDNFLKCFPEKYRGQALVIAAKISKGVGIYVGSKIILMFAVCLMATSGLFALKVKFALFLGLVAGILEIVPIIGPIISSVPAILVALGQDPQLAVWVSILYFVIFKIANNVLSPVVLGKSLHISPIIIIIALLVGSSVLGVTGVILSPAIVVVIFVLFDELYLKKINPPLEKNIADNSDTEIFSGLVEEKL